MSCRVEEKRPNWTSSATTSISSGPAPDLVRGDVVDLLRVRAGNLERAAEDRLADSPAHDGASVQRPSILATDIACGESGERAPRGFRQDNSDDRSRVRWSQSGLGRHDFEHDRLAQPCRFNDADAIARASTQVRVAATRFSELRGWRGQLAKTVSPWRRILRRPRRGWRSCFSLCGASLPRKPRR